MKQPHPDHINIVSGVRRLKATEGDDGKRLDQFLSHHLPELSRGQWRKVIDLGGTHHNGRRTRKCGLLISSGDLVEAYLDGRSLTPYRVQPEDVLYHDRFVLALNKPPDVETQPTHARYVGTLYEAIKKWQIDQAGKSNRHTALGMVQRLDRGTSGLILFSTHEQAHAGLTRSFTDRTVKKVYLALVQGHLCGKGEFRSLLARSRKRNIVKSVKAGGKEAITRYEALESNKDCSLIKVEPLTGRSHQIRVHFSEAGYPLLGDDRYGGPTLYQGFQLQRHMLHALSLELEHPVSKEYLKLSAPLPSDMHQLLESLSWHTSLSCYGE